MILKKIQDVTISGKKVLVRLDTDVPLSESGEILDETRLIDGLETLRYLLSQNAEVIIIGHLGRPKGAVVQSFSLAPVVAWYVNKLQTAAPIQKQFGSFSGWQLSEHLSVLENLRFFTGEEENSESFAKQLADLATLYVDDAFAVSHRSAASNVGVTKFLPSYAGIQIQKEIEGLSKVLDNPNRPLVVIIGGAKLETKIPLVSKMHQFADAVLVGGKLTQEKQALELATKEQGKATIIIADSDEAGLDITPESVEKFLAVIMKAKTIVWNGPVGKTNGEDAEEEGTRRIAQGIVATDAYTVIGGGDTIEFLDREKLLDTFDFVSTGGGAMLSFLSGETLPALLPLVA